jgi:hypothetical protein
LRELLPEDVPRVAELHAEVFGSTHPRAELESFLSDILFEHPWRDPALPSLACVDPAGVLVGCLGAMPRPMTFRGESIQALVTHDFMVDPSSRGTLAAIQLIRAIAPPSVNLTITEPNAVARRMMEAMGGAVIRSRSSRWVRVFSPATLGAQRLRPRTSGVLGRVLHGLGSVVDLVATRLPRVAPRAVHDNEADARLDPATLLDLLTRNNVRRALRPEYTVATLTWLLDTLAKTRRNQALRSGAVLQGGTPVGWYIYYSRPGDLGRVLQIGAAPDHHHQVLDHLFSDAARSDNLGLSGQADPEWQHALDAKSCFTRARGTWIVARSRSPAILEALDTSEAFLSRLEGESWLGFAF